MLPGLSFIFAIAVILLGAIGLGFTILAIVTSSWWLAGVIGLAFAGMGLWTLATLFYL